MLREVRAGLRSSPKRLPCKLFYDELGSQLFEQICELEEYYLTRTELSILRRHAPDIARALGPDCVLLEFGSGASTKTRLLLDALLRPQAYVPIDISRSALAGSVAALRVAYPALDVRPICGDYTTTLALPRLPDPSHRVIFFPGSTIGNFDPQESIHFLERLHALGGPKSQLLIGFDLKKDSATLEAAYNDRQGVTADFNRNVLRVINRECGTRFPLEAFTHRAVYNAACGRIEMHLVSLRQQSVDLSGELVHFSAGEAIVTEHCHKYDLDQFEELARRGGFAPERTWTDPAQRFCVQLLRAS